MASYVRLGDLLVSLGMISEQQLQQALQKQKETKHRLGEVLIENNIVSEQQIIEALQLQLGVEFIDLTNAQISPDMAKLLPKNIAKRYSVIPVKVIGDELYLAMTDPLNFQAQEDVRDSTHKRVIPMIATSAGMEHAILDIYGNENAKKAIEDMRREMGTEETVVNPTIISNQIEDANSAPTIRLVNSVIERALGEGASDIHFEPNADSMRVRFRVDGVMRNVLDIPQSVCNAVTSRIKVMSNMDVAERRIPQDGRANVRMHDMEIDLRISTLPTIYGEKTTIRLLKKNLEQMSMEGIGLAGSNLEKFRRLVLHNSSGVILIAGPTGSGKSSTMYTILESLNNEQVNIITLEDPVEYNMDGVNQVQINEKVGMTFASGLRSILRQDPDIISVGEIRDGETAQIAMRAAITGHLVISTIHTNSAVATLDRLIDIGVEPYLIASALKGVISQRLVRRICPHCRTSYFPTSEEEDLLGLPPEEHGKHLFYKGKGCAECFRTGYHGRIAVFEILLLNREIGKSINNLSERDKMEKAVQDSGFETMQANCCKLVLDGISTVSEVYKAIQSTDY